jgi:hypothetical protein
LPKWKTQTIRWKGDKARILEAWLAEVDKNDEADLFRRLYEWKLSESFDWRKRDARGQQIIADLQARFRAAATPAQRQTVLRKFDLWFQLDEENACSLYERDARATSAYSRQTVTGVVVNRTLGLSRQERRRLRATAHQLGLQNGSQDLGALNAKFQGKVAYLSMLNPQQALPFKPSVP